MPAKTLQKDPPEGSRAVIDRELKRKGLEGRSAGGDKGKKRSNTEAQKKNKAAMDKAAPQTGTRGGP